MPDSLSTNSPDPDRLIGSGQDARPLLDAEEKYRRLHENMTDAFVIVTMAGRITESNRSYRELVGYTEEELGHLTYIEMTPGKWHDFEARIVAEQIIPHGHSEIYEKECRRKDGTLVPIELRAFLIRGDDGEPAAMWAIVRDITGRKRLEEALRESNALLEQRVSERTAELRESETRFRCLAEATFEGLAMIDNGIIIDANDQFLAMLRCDFSQLIGARVLNYIAPRSRALTAKNMRTGHEGPYQTYGLKHDGTEFPAEVRARMMTLKGRRIRVSAIRDLTESRLIEAELHTQRSNFARTRHLAMLGEVGAGITHQIAQPLCAMMNNVAAAKAAIGSCKAQTCGAIGMIIDLDADVRRMRGIVERLRGLQQPGRQQREPVVLNDLVEQTLQLMHLDEGHYGIDLVTRLQKDLRAVAIERVQMAQVVINLIQNAIDALDSASGGERKITIATREPGPGTVELSVSDTGPGMDPGDLPQIFEIFFTTKDEGAGVGLALSRRIVSAHGGTIEAENNGHQPGATFRVVLPTGEMLP